MLSVSQHILTLRKHFQIKSQKNNLYLYWEKTEKNQMSKKKKGKILSTNFLSFYHSIYFLHSTRHKKITPLVVIFSFIIFPQFQHNKKSTKKSSFPSKEHNASNSTLQQFTKSWRGSNIPKEAFKYSRL